MNSTTITSSNEVAKANTAPVATPGVISGSVTRRKQTQGLAPRPLAARVMLWSNDCRAAQTVITTKGVPRTVWARITPR
ncbi:hypothetical protein D3C84_1100570 [compost metagenome]